MTRKTRKDRYEEKLKTSKKYNISLAIIGISNDNNVGFAIRTAACFGLKKLYVIGSPADKQLHNGLSGTTFDFVDIVNIKSTNEFLEFVEKESIHLISAELTDNAKNLYDFEFPLEKEIILIIGNESFGVPGEIIFKSETVYIPMGGPGFCLNTVMAGTAIISEYMRQLSCSDNSINLLKSAS